MARWLLLCDIGNTSIKFGLQALQAGAPLSYSLPTNPAETVDSLGLNLLALCRHAGVEPGAVLGCLACSVAPFVDPLLREACRKFFGCPVRFAHQDLPIPLENRYERPLEVGADRLVTAFAARSRTTAPAVICVDFGTATTFDCVAGQAYLGGLICPGVLSSASALASRTAKLPLITLELDSPQLELGKSTSQSLNQGLIFGFAAMTEGLCKRIKGVLGGGDLPPESIPVIATGGFAPRIAEVCDCFDEVNPGLLLEGLRLLYEKNAPF